ncbi:hypothetical protein GJAV_G00263980 [Gymnothorax javanicus]|nr:hypothetical protein GJAV_G00263980 [Gymnothorax javanicus]
MMGLNGHGWFVRVTLLALVVTVNCVRRRDLFPYGENAGDQLLESGSDVTQELPLEKSMYFFDGSFDSVYINTNGFISIAEPTSEAAYLGNMPASFGMIAVFLGDLETDDGAGRVYFRQDSSPSVLQRAKERIRKAFPLDDEVEPVHAMVVTWENVASRQTPSRGDGLPKKRNTFQLVVASMETASYAILLYPEDGMQFHSTPVEGSTQEPIEAGFSKGLVKGWFWRTSQGPYYQITSEDEASVRELSEATNSGRRGVWVYEIGTYPFFSAVTAGPGLSSVPAGTRDTRKVLHQVPDRKEVAVEERESEESYGEPLPVHPVQYQPQNPQVVVVDEGEIDVDVFSYNFETCANNRHKCSNFADCRDYSGGYCCHCRPGYYGNGKNCVAEGKPQRMNGKVNGRVFIGGSSSPIQFSNNDLHSYVVANDGRAYVAISTIPPSVGPSLLPLSSIGGVIGWAFALEQPGYQNGFSIIGGEFTRQAEVTFLPGNEKLTIKQVFKGIDDHDHLVVSTDLEGRLPEVPLGSTVQIDPYSEIYQYSSNTITSASTRAYRVTLTDGSFQTRSYQWRQNIVFQSCPHDEASRAVPASQQLSVDQVFVMYDPGNQLIRFAMSNKIGSIHGGEPEQNPCFTGRHGCDTNAVCRPGQGNQFTCECTAGFSGDGRTCRDIDECRERPQVCGPHATCNNQPGTFRCECRQGFQFASDGQTCIESDRPVDHCRAGTHNCDIPERARCSYTGSSGFVCSCLPGFEGDGRACRDIDECQPGRCHRDAVCYNTQGSFTCQCRPGFHGDGFQCSSEREKTPCERQRDSAQASSTGFGHRPSRPALGAYVPSCDAHGNYHPTQCQPSIGQCWCVDRHGNEIPGTRSRGRRPLCVEHDVIPGPVGPTPKPDISPLPPGTHLLFAQNGKIDHIPLDASKMKTNEAKTLLHLPDTVVIAVAYDCAEKMVYWTDITGPAISKASINGGDPIPIIRTDLESPEGIAIDHLGRNMFWTDSILDRIEVAALDGTKRRVLFDTDLVNPRPIVVDPIKGHLYWADWNRDGPKIETSYMDGTNRKLLVRDGLGLPNGLTYDPHTTLLCWADAGTRKVECMSPTQNNRRKVVEGIRYPFGIAAFGRNLYYTDWRRDAVVGVDRTLGRETEDFLPQKRSRLYGITTAYSQCPSGQNYCSVNNGGCTHLCLATPSGRTCMCPDNAVGVSCVERGSRY